MKDYFGRNLYVGDVVAYTSGNYADFYSGKIVRFTPKCVVVTLGLSVDHTNPIKEHTTIKFPHCLIKRESYAGII